MTEKVDVDIYDILNLSNLSDEHKTAADQQTRHLHYSKFVEDINEFLMRSYHYKTKPITTDHSCEHITAKRSAFDIQLLFKPRYLIYGKQTLEIEKLILRQNDYTPCISILKLFCKRAMDYEYAYLHIKRPTGILALILDIQQFERIPETRNYMISVARLSEKIV